MRRTAVVATIIVASVLIQFGRATTQSGAAAARERAYRESNVGVARLERFEYGEAAGRFRRALEIDPTLTIAHLNLAIALFYDAKLDEADREARVAASRMPSAPQPPYIRGLVARAAGRDEEAAALFRRVLAIDPADIGARIQLGQVLTSRQQYAEAADLLQQALTAEPLNATAAYGIAIALTRSGRSADGREAMARFQRLRDNPASITYSNAYLGQGRYAEAVLSTGLEPELVDPAIPSAHFVDATRAVIGEPPPAGVRSVTLADLRGSGELDLAVATDSSIDVYRNDRGRFDAGRRRSASVGGTRPVATIAGDYDDDGRTDLFVLGTPTNRLFRQEADGAFRDVTQSAAFPPAIPAPATAAFADVDHDGDLDIVVGGESGLQLLRNDGNGRFVDATGGARLRGATHAVSIVPTDFDNHRDTDLLVVRRGAPPALFSNLRDGTFRDVAAAMALSESAAYTSVTAGDVNKDGFTDLFFGRRGAPGLLAASAAGNRFAIAAAPAETLDALAAQFVDYDNDGLLDLFVLTTRGPRLLRSVGRSFVDVSARALPADARNASDPPASMALGDVDGDGDVDAIIRLSSGGLRVWRNEGGNARRSLSVRLKAQVSNRTAVGSKVEIRAGSLFEKIETSSTAPAVAPAGIVFGLGARERADVVRVLWPAGILQAEVDPPAATGASSTASMVVTELNRKPSSCPYLFFWNGSRFEFLTDFMGGGEMGSWVAPGIRDVPDPDEYVRIGSDRLQPRAGRYELRVTNELEEAIFIDRLQLVAVAHPRDVEAYPNEGLRSAEARAPFTIYTVHDPHPPLRAVTDDGRDALEQIRFIDGRYVDTFGLERIQGYARRHSLTLTLDVEGAARVVLLLTGWTDYAFSSDNVAAHQAGLSPQPPLLEVEDERGEWNTAVPELGLPVGRPQTIAVDLTKVLPRHRSRVRVRIVTNLRVYWDQIVVDTSEPARVEITRIDPTDAVLRPRGFSRAVSPAARAPLSFDYDQVSPDAPWKTMPGHYTKFGDVTPLLTASDDRFVVSAPGDEVAVSFDAAALPPIPAGWRRTFLLYADGFSKEMNLHSSSPDRLAPLPFHGMTRYPYLPPERYPATPAHQRYRAEYNTRIVGGPIPPLPR